MQYYFTLEYFFFLLSHDTASEINITCGLHSNKVHDDVTYIMLKSKCFIPKM